MRILLTGASGYVGGRLAPLLIAAGHELVLMTREPASLAGRFEGATVVRGDVLDPASLPVALAGIDLVYYLVHSMADGEGDFAARDLLAARNLARAAHAAGVKRIVYLGGLGDEQDSLSHHLASRQATGKELAAHGVPVTELRAAVVIGSGSASFEILRHLTERLPVMITPKWVRTRCQPIAIADVLAYLVATAVHPEVTGIVEIGGPDVLSYGEMMEGYARARGLRRLMIPVPVLTPRLSSYWVGLVSPVPSAVARPLIEGLRNEVIVHHPEPAARLGVTPMGYASAVSRAIDRTARGERETTWFDAFRARHRGHRPPPTSTEGMLLDRREMAVAASPDQLFGAVETIGGATTWPFLPLWELRGLLDRILGGPGMRLGRRDREHLRPGDALDFWRVDALERPGLLRLRAEMKVPGAAWLQFETLPGTEPGSSRLIQTAFFEPRGLAGLLYWYALVPIHGPLFGRLIGRLAARAVRDAARSASGPGTPMAGAA